MLMKYEKAYAVAAKDEIDMSWYTGMDVEKGNDTAG